MIKEHKILVCVSYPASVCDCLGILFVSVTYRTGMRKRWNGFFAMSDHSLSTECLETAQSLANMLLLGNSCRHVTSKVHARSCQPLQRRNVLSDSWSKLLNIWVRRVTKAKIPRDRYF